MYDLFQELALDYGQGYMIRTVRSQRPGVPADDLGYGDVGLFLNGFCSFVAAVLWLARGTKGRLAMY